MIDFTIFFKTNNYLFDISGGDSFIGKLRSNMLGTQFTIYDGGEVG